MLIFEAMKLNSQTQTLESNFTGRRVSEISEHQKGSAHQKNFESDTQTDKDILVSNFEGIDFLPDQPAKESEAKLSDSPLKKPEIKSSVNNSIQNNGHNTDSRVQNKIVRMSTDYVFEGKQDVKAEMAAVKRRIESTQKDNIQILENSSIMYSCLASYVGYYFSENESKETTNSILNKCLGQGKVNYPDLFLRFMD